MNSTQQSIIVGAVLGAALGALGGYLFTRDLNTSDEAESLTLYARSVPAGSLLKLLISIMGVLRGISQLGEKS